MNAEELFQSIINSIVTKVSEQLGPIIDQKVADALKGHTASDGVFGQVQEDVIRSIAKQEVESAIEDLDVDTKIDDAIADLDIDREVTKAIQNGDADDAIKDVVKNLTFTVNVD